MITRTWERETAYTGRRRKLIAQPSGDGFGHCAFLRGPVNL